jgi:hypothetical protein
MRSASINRIITLLSLVLLYGAWVPSELLANPAPTNNPGIQLTTEVIPLDIWFGDGKAVLKRGPHNTPVLKTLESRLKEPSIVHIEIVGSPDTAASAKSNKTLSLRRAEALRDTIADLFKISADRIQADSAGASAVFEKPKSVVTPDEPRLVYVILYRLNSSRSPASSKSL